MQILVAFKNVEPSDNAKKYLKMKLERFKKMIHHPESVHAVFKMEKMECIVDVNLVSKKMDIHASNSGKTFNEAIDLVLEKVRKQLMKIKGKTENYR